MPHLFTIPDLYPILDSQLHSIILFYNRCLSVERFSCPSYTQFLSFILSRFDSSEEYLSYTILLSHLYLPVSSCRIIYLDCILFLTLDNLHSIFLHYSIINFCQYAFIISYLYSFFYIVPNLICRSPTLLSTFLYNYTRIHLYNGPVVLEFLLYDYE